MTDHIETIGSSIIQHGSANNRVYLMKLTRQDCPDIISQLDRLALNQGYTKIFAKVPSTALEQFLDSGYELEASIPGFYHPDDVCFLGKYYCQTRKREGEPEQISLVLAAARQQKQVAEQHLPEGFVCRIAEEHDTVAMTKVYRAVFASYPFPIFDPAYLKEIMGATLFFGI